MNTRRCAIRFSRGALVLVVCCTGTAVVAQMTDSNGTFQPQAFLAYGPFSPAVGQLPCNTTTDELRANFISPEAITCFTPELEDEPGWDGLWDPALGTQGLYHGPLGLDGDPVVRAYGGTLPDLDSEYGGDDRAQWMITYLEYTGATAIDVEFCVETDDGVIMFLDGQEIHANQVCRGIPALCAGDSVPVTIDPGAHVLSTAVFDRGGGWQLRMSLQVAGVPVVDGDPDWIFHGTARPPPEDFSAGEYPCFELPVIIPGIPEVTCELNDQGDAEVTWTLPPDLADVTESIDVTLNGVLIDTVSVDTTDYTVEAEEIEGLATVGICVQPAGAARPTCCGLFLGGEVYINCGGAMFVDTEGRVWLEDTQANPSPFLTSPPTNVDGPQPLPDLTFDQNIMDNLFPAEIFEMERWSDGPVEYTITGIDDSRTYDVHLLFKEHCCSDGCLDGDPLTEPCDAVSDDASPPLVDPQLVSSACRIFSIYVNDQIVRQQWSKSLWAACLSGNLPGTSSYNIAVSVLVEDLEPVDGAIKVLIEDLGGGNPPENASIKAVAIIESGGAVEPRDEFGRGDSDANGGAPNITDGIYILNFLFLGGPAPVCMDAADADDNGSVNITDGIYVLNFLFLGGTTIPTPAAPNCGEDPTDDPLDCTSFPPCE